MRIVNREINGYVEINLSGRLDTNTSKELENVLMDFINKGNVNLIMNLSELTYLSSSGLRVFLLTAKLLDAKGFRLNLIEVPPFIREVFDIAGFGTIFNFHSTIDEIIN